MVGNVTMVVPTRNRLHTLRLVAPSYCTQDLVDEIIFVDDAGDDDLSGFAGELRTRYPGVSVLVTRNATRAGASESRNVGARMVKNEYVLFCDDDEYLESNYAATCLRKLIDYNAGVVSGRRVYMREGEDITAALTRFGDGNRDHQPYDELLCEVIAGSRFVGDYKIPFTNAIIVTRAEHLRTYGFDPAYFEGNAYREESDYQMNLYVHGYDNIITGDVHSIHLPPSAIRKPGAVGRPRSRPSDVYWSIHYTAYFYRKYWAAYAKRRGIKIPGFVALAWFSIFIAYRIYFRPTLVTLAYRAIELRSRLRNVKAGRAL